MPGALTPYLCERLVELGAWLPFRPAARMLARFTGVTVSEATARRQTEQAGATLAAMEAAEVTRLERAAPAPPAGPPVQQVTVDGAMVPLRGGEWGEVKLLTIGEIDARPDAEPKAIALSYFGRRADHETFARLATAETHRRGVATAGTVVGVCDGAGWCQGFLDYHRPDAVRILDFPHAVGYLRAAAEAAWGAGTTAAEAWMAAQAHELKHGDPLLVLGAIEGLPTATEAQRAATEYLGARFTQIRYARFLAAGYPIGSGAGESGHKVVTEARLKGAGMHWAPDHVDPMMALRCAACSDRWEAAWGQVGPALRARGRRSRPRAAASSPAPAARERTPKPGPALPTGRDAPPMPTPTPLPTRPKLVVDGKPTASHPWKRHACLSAGRARHAVPKL